MVSDSYGEAEEGAVGGGRLTREKRRKQGARDVEGGESQVSVTTVVNLGHSRVAGGSRRRE